MPLSAFSEEPSTDSELLVLDTLFAFVKHLPCLTSEANSGYYYVQGKLERSDLESLYKVAGRIGELTLDAEPDSPRLALHVLARIAQLQDPDKPLFPFLHHLRIIKTSAFLDFLHLFLSPTLRTVELTGISVDDPCYSSVLSFLECAILQAPELSTLTLGPGLISNQILNISLGYKNLRCLKCLDLKISITDQFLQDIGSLPHLGRLYLQLGDTSKYKGSSVISTTTAVHADRSQEASIEPILSASDDEGPSTGTIRSPSPSPESTASDNPSPTLIPDAASQTIASKLFPVLKSLMVHGDISLMQDLIEKVSSPNVRELLIDFTIPLKSLQPPNINMLDIPLATKGRKRLFFPRVSSSSQQQALPQISTTEIVSLMNLSIQKWANTLAMVSFTNNVHTPITFSLPSNVFKDLLLCPDMEHLVISGMGVDSMDGTLDCLKQASTTNPESKLKILHLPIHPTAPVISLTRLRYIAEACSHLKFLRCRFGDLSNIPIFPPMSHQLEELSVPPTDPPSVEQQQRSFDIARFLNSIFPNLKSIRTHEGDGNTIINNSGGGGGGDDDDASGQWRFIFDLIKFCQGARMDDEGRR